MARTSFVGRERETAQVRRALAVTPLVTLTGAGGCGKTRLALEVAGELVRSYPDGAWLVELAPLSEAGLVPQAVAAALGVREQPGRTLTDTLVDTLRRKKALLLMDNCEHLVGAAARLVDALLGACPRLRVLATSREPLGVAGEVSRRVPPLSVPDDDLPSAAGDLTRYEAPRLFVERARARLPDFELTPENARAVAEVCRRVDEIPLAIELATAWVTALAVEQVAERLEDSLGLLTGGARTATPRQQSLRGALDWSYGLLEEAERRMFGRLSVFAGGWTLEAAEAAGTGDGLQENDVLDLLGRLVDKSLVVAQTAGDGTLRYRLLEPVRQYARERFEEYGEAEKVRRRHAEFFLALAEEAEPELAGARQLAWLEKLAAEHDNLRAALSWALGDPGAGGRAEPGLRMATALARFWAVFGLSEGRGWLQKGLAQSGTASASVRAKALNEAGWVALFQGDPRAVAMLEEGLTLFKELGDKSGAATAAANLGFALAHAGARERVAALREEAEALRREPLAPRALAQLLAFLGMAALDAYDYEQAIALPEQSLALHRELGDSNGVVVSLTALGMTTLEAGEPERAKPYFEENLRLLRNTGHRFGIAYCLLGLAGVAGEQLQPERAARLWGAAEDLRETIGMSLSPFDRTHYAYEARVAAARSRLGEAAFEVAWAEGKAMSQAEAIEYALGDTKPVPTKTPARRSTRPRDLTRREREIAALIAREMPNRQIALELSISERTVETHVRNILKKLGLKSRVLLVDRLPAGQRR